MSRMASRGFRLTLASTYEDSLRFPLFSYLTFANSYFRFSSHDILSFLLFLLSLDLLGLFLSPFRNLVLVIALLLYSLFLFCTFLSLSGSLSLSFSTFTKCRCREFTIGNWNYYYHTAEVSVVDLSREQERDDFRQLAHFPHSPRGKSKKIAAEPVSLSPLTRLSIWRYHSPSNPLSNPPRPLPSSPV